MLRGIAGLPELKDEINKTKLLDLGRKGYREVWELQEQLLEEVKEKKIPGGNVLQTICFW